MTGYQLKITIKRSKPPIWRRVIVPEKISFADLDDVIECIFGWEHAHLYEFYFPGEGTYISMPDDFADDFDSGFGGKFSADKTCVDNWINAGDKFEYTYDFGDDWEHTVLVEKLVPYEKRYAQVIKSKGPNMIEDCGGIWGFYECMEEASDFDIDEVNASLKHMEFGECEEQKELDSDSLRNEREEMEDFLRELRYEMAGGENIPPLKLSLKDVFAGYKKENLVMIAKAHGFSGYSKFRKNELAEWLANHLLETAFMRQVLESVTKYEIRHFEAAMEGGEFISESLMSESLFLCTYGAYNDMFGTLQIPKDVREKYQKICTLDFRKKLEKKWKLTDYCNSAIYLYGIVPVSKLVEIYRRYTGEDITEDVIYALAAKRDGIIGEGFLREDLLMEEQFTEDSLYQFVMKEQGDVSYYIPEDEKEFLVYGEEECQEPDGHTEEIIIYLQERYGLEDMEAYTVFYDLQSAIRVNYSISQLVGLLAHILADWNKELNGRKNIKEAENKLKNLQNYTRAILYRGHTRKEYLDMQRPEQMRRDKVVAFPGAKKIYPNDPCPCGSGKKYKKCCGRNKK